MPYPGDVMDLRDRLSRLIQAEGPITVAQYMMLCLQDPQSGYYATRPALGQDGDFITAPEVSQMFGEMLGIWALSVWDQMGRPARVQLVELGPGTGALMSDVLRAGRALPGFVDAAEVWLVEASRPLRVRQQQRLAGASPRFADALDQVPEGVASIVIANEFLDCLPLRQFLRRDGDWHEQRVGLDAQGGLVFGLSPAPRGLAAPAEAPEGAVFEQSSAQDAVVEQLAHRVLADGGAALLIDYGRDQPAFGDTLQALSAHQRVDPLALPGVADLTAHVDFPSVAAAAQSTGAGVSAILTQAELLRNLGIEARAAALAKARPDQEAILARQLDRLIGEDQMGRLFKALAIHAPGLTVPGFPVLLESLP